MSIPGSVTEYQHLQGYNMSPTESVKDSHPLITTETGIKGRLHGPLGSKSILALA